MQVQLDVHRFADGYLQGLQLGPHESDRHIVHALVLAELGDLLFIAYVAAVVVEDLIANVTSTFYGVWLEASVLRAKRADGWLRNGFVQCILKCIDVQIARLVAGDVAIGDISGQHHVPLLREGSRLLERR